VTENNNNGPEIIEYPLRIRAHTLICLQGFKGMGYSEKFIAQMDKIISYLRKNLKTQVKVLAEADIFCTHCPHNYRGRCTLEDPEDQPVPFESPDNAVIMDRRALTWLGLTEGEVYEWREILYKVGGSVDSSAMDVLCGDCRWRKYKVCSVALDELNQRVASGEFLYQKEK